MRSCSSIRIIRTVLEVGCGWLAASFWMPLQANNLLVRQALMAFEQQKFPEARVYIDDALETTNTQIQENVWYYRGVIYEKLLRDQIATEEADQLFKESLHAYRKVLALTSSKSQYHSFAKLNLNGLWAYYLDRGRRYCKQEAFDNAIKQFECCKTITPNHYTYLYMAIAAHQKEEYDLALLNYTHYLSSGVTVPVAVYRGWAHLNAYSFKDPEKASKILKEALLQYPFDNNLLYEQLQHGISSDQIEAQEKRIQEQIATISNTAAAHYQLGYEYEQQGQWEQALDQYKKAAELAPVQVEPVRQQGILHYNRAAHSIQEMIKMSEEQFQQVGAQQIKQCEHHLLQALSYFEQARKRSPRDIFMLQHLKIIYQRLNKPARVKKMERRLRKYRLS